jgi:squalene-associated FAD-dependent desaturase
MNRRRVVVCGGGLAGIAAACEASLLGAEVTLVERRPFLGGKAYSFTDDEAGVEVDNGQHVFLGCCTAYIALLRLIGAYADTTLQPALDVPVRDRAGRSGALRASRLPAPLHLGPSFATYPLLSHSEKAAAVRALLALGVLRESQRAELDEVTFAEWLIAHGQGVGAIERFWDLIVLPTCNDRSDRVSAALATFVFQEGFFRTRTGSAIGWSRVGLTRLVDPPARRFLELRGATIVTGRGVTALGDRSVELSDGTRLEADAVVLAIPPDRIREICPAALPDGPDLGSSPIVNVHVWYDRAVMEGLFTAVVDSPAQWVFNRTAMAGLPNPGQHLAVSISGARDEVGRSKATLVDEITAELCHLFPRALVARIERTLCVKEPEATFAAAPGQADSRPGTRTSVAGVVLAGAWTDTGWPATMEGAVRSGLRAAREAAKSPEVVRTD